MESAGRLPPTPTRKMIASTACATVRAAASNTMARHALPLANASRPIASTGTAVEMLVKEHVIRVRPQKMAADTMGNAYPLRRAPTRMANAERVRAMGLACAPLQRFCRMEAHAAAVRNATRASAPMDTVAMLHAPGRAELVPQRKKAAEPMGLVGSLLQVPIQTTNAQAPRATAAAIVPAVGNAPGRFGCPSHR